MTTNELAVLGIGVTIIVAAIRQADWKQPPLIWSMLAIGALLVLIPAYSDLAAWVSSVTRGLRPEPPRERPSWIFMAHGVSLASAAVLMIWKRSRGMAADFQHFAVDALNVATLYALVLVAASAAVGWPDAPSTMVRLNPPFFIVTAANGVSLILEALFRSTRDQRQAGGR